MAVMAILVFALLQLVALVHVGWAFGMSWPAKTRDDLGAMVVGTPKGVPMPAAWLTLAVALMISGLGYVALWGGGLISLGEDDRIKGWVLLGVALIFAVRGALGYMPFGPLRASAEPFRSLDRRYFSPLILLLSAGFIGLFLTG